MGFWIFALCSNLVVPLLMVILGWLLWRHTSKFEKGFVVYRTRQSLLSTEEWNEARKRLGKLWFQVGLALLIPSVVCLVPFYAMAKSSEDLISYVMVIAMFVQLFLLFVPILTVEISLSRKINSKEVAYENKVDDSDERNTDVLLGGVWWQDRKRD